ncbi:MAG: ATP-dependent DNA helicase, partial [Thiotrichaceae bacterium]|nr:ATP-dependent DNA helicase [Thiotrichaceae bacterium]
GFQARESQLAMAQLIQKSIAERNCDVIEASTGIGKSFAYLVPAFLSNSKILISTGTKNLQDQLFKKDIPLINKTIVSGKQLALLKGRSNYCCPYHLNKSRQQPDFQTRQYAPIFDALKSWSESSVIGDISEFTNLPERDPLWQKVTSTQNNCLSNECPDYEICFVIKARRKAQKADVIVINHHLFFSDQAIKDEGFGELLPEVDVLIFDEAHQLPDIAGHFFGRSLTM